MMVLKNHKIYLNIFVVILLGIFLSNCDDSSSNGELLSNLDLQDTVTSNDSIIVDDFTYSVNDTDITVYDGDTFSFYVGEDRVKIRFYGIDAPEKKQFFGDSATIYLENMVKDRTVFIKVLYNDRYGRCISKVYVDGVYINLSMVEYGYAWWYEYFAKDNVDLENAQKNAQENRLGLWKYDNPINSYGYRQGVR